MEFGRVYFYNSATKESAWELPPGATVARIAETQEAAAAAEATDDGGEEEYVAPFECVPKTVTVGGARNMNEARQAVATCGEIEAAWTAENEGGRQWCFRFSDDAAATSAMYLNGSSVGTADLHLTVRRTMQRNVGDVVEPTKVFLRGLPLDVEDDEVLAFLECGHPGEASQFFVRKIFPRSGGCPRGSSEKAPWSGLAVVDLRSEKTAQRALRADGRTLTPRSGGEARKVAVNISRRRVWEGVSALQNADGESHRKADSSKGAPMERPSDCLTAWIGGLPKDAEEGSVKAAMESCGELSSFRFIRDNLEGDCRGFAFACFSTVQGVEAAVKLHGKYRLGATPLKVRYSNEGGRPDRPRR